MEIKKMTLFGHGMSSNCYLLINNDKAIVVDPGFEDNNLFNFIKTKDLTVETIILTHGHFDHWGGLNKLRTLFPDAKLYASTLDYYWFEVGPNNRYGYEPKIDYDLNKLNTIDLFNETFKVIKVPGHSLGSIAIYSGKVLISGDVLFFQGVGRYDLYGGNENILLNSIKKLYSLADDVVCYSGHGRETTIGYEKKHNPFIRG